MPSVDIGATIAASFRFLGPAWGRAWGVLAVTLLVVAGLQALGAVWSDWFWSTIVTTAVTLVVSAWATAALYRIGLADRHAGDAAFRPGFAGLALGALEWRVLLSGLIVNALFAVLLAAVLALCGLIFVLTGTALDTDDIQDFQTTKDQLEQVYAVGHMLFGPTGLVCGFILTLALVGLFWLGARLMLYALSAADTGSLSLGRAWTLSRGATGAIWVTWILITVVEGVIGEAVSIPVGIFTGNGSPTGGVWPGVVHEAADWALNAPLFAGMQLYVYKLKCGAVAGPAATFG